MDATRSVAIWAILAFWQTAILCISYLRLDWLLRWRTVPVRILFSHTKLTICSSFIRKAQNAKKFRPIIYSRIDYGRISNDGMFCIFFVHLCCHEFHVEVFDGIRSPNLRLQWVPVIYRDKTWSSVLSLPSIHVHYHEIHKTKRLHSSPPTLLFILGRRSQDWRGKVHASDKWVQARASKDITSRSLKIVSSPARPKGSQ